jgi:hypothetical protein
MQRSQTIIAIAVLATAIGAATTLGPNLWQGLWTDVEGTDVEDDAIGPETTRGALGQRRAQLARLAHDPDIDQELIELLQGLESDLETQREVQEILVAQLAELKRERSTIANFAESDANADPAQTLEETVAEDPDAQRMARFRARRGPATEERLVAAGFGADQAREIVSRADAMAMERLNMQYQATREGWIDTDRYRDALTDLPDVREVVTNEYGDDAYDRYLYAAGRPNRLVVQDVFQDSPAGAAGLQPGDRVIAMADERIYSTRDLMNVASSGREGETVPLVVERGEAVFELYVPRGPLGIRGGRGFENPADP